MVQIPGEILSERPKVLLNALTGLFIETGEPISSSELSVYLDARGIHIPPSTIRLELSRLESAGYLNKPHASAGRVPTAIAYRAYVDEISLKNLPVPLDKDTAEACRALSGELGKLLSFAGEVLASESGCLGFVTGPNQNEAKIGIFKIDRLEENTVLLRLELQSGRVYHHLTKLPPAMTTLRLNDLANFLTERTSGRKLLDVTESEIEALIKHATEWGRGLDVFIHPVHDLITDARLGESPKTVIYGTAGLLKSGGDSQSLARAVALIEDQNSFLSTLEKIPGDKQVRIIIGGADNVSLSDKEVDEVLNGFSLVIAKYHIHSRSQGQLGILGPQRMPYLHQIALVHSLSDILSRLLISRELGFNSL